MNNLREDAVQQSNAGRLLRSMQRQSGIALVMHRTPPLVNLAGTSMGWKQIEQRKARTFMGTSTERIPPTMNLAHPMFQEKRLRDTRLATHNSKCVLFILKPRAENKEKLQ